jgi:hypothetical protein
MSDDSPVAILHNTSGTEIGTASNPIRNDPTGSTTQPISATALPLPSGAATAIKQPALGTAGTPSADVISVQGVSGGTPQPVSDGGGSITVDGTVTANAGTGPFPVSDNGGSLTVDGAVTANIGTSGSLALDATLTGGTQKAITRGGAKGATSAADVTSTAEGADHQALDVQVYHGGAAVNPTAIRALTATDVVTAAQGTAAALAGAWPVKVTDGTNAMPTMDTAGRSGFERITDGTNTAAVKAASTAAVASDPALVVAISPNNTPVLPNGAATSALQSTGNTSLGNIDTKLPATVGQKAMSASLAVVLASDQSAVSIVPTVVPNKTDVTGTISALNGVVVAPQQGWSSGVVTVTGTWAAVLVLELSSDGGTTWILGGFAAPPTELFPMTRAISYLTENSSYQFLGMGPNTHLRIRAAQYVSGTVNIRITLSDSPAPILTAIAQVQQNVVESVYNSSVANLAVGAAFTGIAESTLGVAAIRVMVKASQLVRLALQQSADGTNWDVEDDLECLPTDGDSHVFQVAASYFRVVVTNVGYATTTYLRVLATLCPILEVMPRTLTPHGHLRISSMTDGWIPDPSVHQDYTQNRALLLDVDRSLQVRGRVLTDEASFRDDFASTNPYKDLTGTVYVTNGSDFVTGVGTAFRSELNSQHYVKLSTHGDTAYDAVAEILSDTVFKLDAPYTGATGSGTGRASWWKYAIGTGGSIVYAASEIALASGTTSGTAVQAVRPGDYLPYSLGFRLRLSQRIANQTTILGLSDDPTTPNNQALLILDGTTNTSVKCRSSSSSVSIEETTVTLPGGATTATAANWQIEVLPNRVVFYYNDIRIAEHKTHIPGSYDTMDCYIRIVNTGVAGSSTTVYADVFWFNNYDMLQVGTLGKDAVITREARATNATVASVTAAVADTVLLVGNPLRMGASVVNDSTAILYLKLGTGASTTSYSVRMTSFAYFELPFGYTGQINGYWAAANGAARVTEVIQ